MKKKALLAVLCMVLIAAVSVMGTLAWLTDRETVTNTFTVGNVSIKVDEVKVDENGDIVVDDEGNWLRTEEGNQYHIIPGWDYEKDPTLTVLAGSEPSYVRMILTVHNASAVKAIIENHGYEENYDLEGFCAFIDGWEPNEWRYKGFTEDAEENTISFEFRYRNIVEVEGEDDLELLPLFIFLNIPGEITGEELQTLQDGGFKMVVEGHAIQSLGLGGENAAWAAFDEQINAG